MLNLIATITALEITIIQPFLNNEYTFGSNIPIRWTYPENATVPESVSFVLLDGSKNMNDAVSFGEVANVSPSLKSITIKTPEVPDGKSYFIRVGNDGDYRYSSAFAIKSNSTESSPPATEKADKTDSSSAQPEQAVGSDVVDLSVSLMISMSALLLSGF
eukprot:NODE_307_length_11332_cov_0.276774.p7 type:complete len:160 gc:universal NODE_307_length_11332_cov_0.276774:751-1230(+)